MWNGGCWGLVRAVVRCYGTVAKDCQFVKVFIIQRGRTHRVKMTLRTFFKDRRGMALESGCLITGTLNIMPAVRSGIITHGLFRRQRLVSATATACFEGPDVMKQTCQLFLSPLNYIINLSFNTGIFPMELKKAIVLPTHKDGDIRMIENYRPIYVLPFFSKIFERLMYDRILTFLNKHNILYKYQFGFKKSHSTYMALTVLIDKILNALDQGKCVVGLFLDFSKAFDTVNHAILLNKLKHYGIRGTALHWLTSYISNRYQYVVYNVRSSEKLITCGVPQGSILGPLLFLLYVNDLPSVSTKLFTLLFADDTNLFIEDMDTTHINQILTEEIGKILIWLKANKLSLNVDKTNFIVFSRRRTINDVYIKIEGKNIERVTKVKFLGVIIDSKLTWKEHINYISNKISKYIGIIYKTKKVLTKSALIGLYYSFVYPYLTYCNILWG